MGFDVVLDLDTNSSSKYLLLCSKEESKLYRFDMGFFPIVYRVT